MSYLQRLIRGEDPGAAGGYPPPTHPWWYSDDPGSASAAGPAVSQEGALRISAVYACVKVLAESAAQLPFILYERNADGRGKHRATDQPLYSVLHDSPNPWQTSFEWRETMFTHALLTGNGYSAIFPGKRGAVDQLVPMHPRCVTVKLGRDNRAVYFYYPPQGGEPLVFLQSEVLHFRALGTDGLKGLSPLALARETLGLAVATEQHGARFFSQGARAGGVLEHPGVLDDDVAERIKRSWQDAHGSVYNSHKIALLEDGMKWHQLSVTNEESQFLETRKFQIAEIARWFRVPPHMIGDLERATFSNIEHQALSFVQHTLMPWLVRFEQACYRDLIAETLGSDFFVEFLVDALLRGDQKSRYESYNVAIIGGFLSPNEARERENMNPREGGDEFLRPLNMTPSSSSSSQPAQPVDQEQLDGAPSGRFARAVTSAVAFLLGDSRRRVNLDLDEPEPETPEERAHAVVRAASERMLRRERAEVEKHRDKHAEAEAWEPWVRGFYDKHASLVQQALQLTDAEVRAYCADRVASLLDKGPDAARDWTAETLVRITTEG